MENIVRVLLTNSPDGMTQDDAESGGVKYRRAINESVTAFRDRAAAQAEAQGCVSIVYGASEDDE